MLRYLTVLSAGTLLYLGVLFIGPEEAALAASGHYDRQLQARVLAVLGISMPCHLARCGGHLDGGSIGGLLIGIAGDSLLFSWDGAMRRGPGPPPDSIRQDAMRVKARIDAWRDSVDMVRPRLGYIRADYPANPGAVSLAAGSPAESLFIEALRSAVVQDSASTVSVARGRALLAAQVIEALEQQRMKFAARRARPPDGEPTR